MSDAEGERCKLKYLGPIASKPFGQVFELSKDISSSVLWVNADLEKWCLNEIPIMVPGTEQAPNKS